MQKNLPIIIFTGFAVAAAGTFGAVMTQDNPMQWLSSAATTAKTEPEVAVTEVPKIAPEIAIVAPIAEPEVAIVAPKVEEPAALETVTPSFDAVRVEPTGEAVISGHAKPGAEVVVKLAGVEVGRTTANAEGSFVLVPNKPLPAGAAALTLETTVGNVVVPSTEQVAVVVKAEPAPAIVAVVTPDLPVLVTPQAEATMPVKSVELSAVDYDAAGNILFQGRVAAGGIVRFYVDNAPVGETIADAKGQWQFKGAAPIAAGTHLLRADEVDATGKVLSRIEQPFLREEPEKVLAAAAPEPALVVPEVVAVPEVAAAPEVVPVAPAPAVPVVEAPVVVVETPVVEQPNRIVIQPGQNLWRISREVYGKGRLYTVIYEANKLQIKNPALIYPGQILTAPKP